MVNFQSMANNVKNQTTATFQKISKKATQTYTNKLKPLLDDGIQYSKNLSKDVVQFAKNNPKKLGVIGGIAMLATIATVAIAKAIKSAKHNKIYQQIVIQQRNTINDLKADIADRQFLIDTLHEINNAKKS